eukprot:gene3903-13973_t
MNDPIDVQAGAVIRREMPSAGGQIPRLDDKSVLEQAVSDGFGPNAEFGEGKGIFPRPILGLKARAPADPILSISEAWKADPDPRKLNLGVGAYRTEGKPLLLNVVRKAELMVINDPTINKEYLPITGYAEFTKLSKMLAFGANSPILNNITTVQCLSGTGSLRVGGEFLAEHYPGAKEVYIPAPSWPTHRSVFRKARIEVKEYRYWKADTRGLDYEGLIADLKSATRGAIVLLHACAHNPTGVDPTPDQWGGILQVVRERGLTPFFDTAYQGFASGCLDNDAASIRMFAAAGVEMLLAQSYAKNMGLYGERVGALSVVCKSPADAKRVESQLKLVIRPMFSNPPIHGAAIAAKVLGTPALYEEWKVELKGMAERIKLMRTQLYNCMKERNAPGDWSFIVKQIGMFSYTGLTKPQCEILTKKWHIYLTMDGRISMAGLSTSKCAWLADAICDAIGHRSRM